MRKVSRHIISFFSVVVALLLLNISIFSTFSSAPIKAGDLGKTSNPNNIETLFELIAEVMLGYEGLLAEKDNDNTPINEEIKVAEYIQPKISYLRNCNIELLNNFGVYTCPKYHFTFEISPPPPKA